MLLSQRLIGTSLGGSTYWAFFIGRSDIEYGSDVAVDSSGNAYVVGYNTLEGAGVRDIFVVKCNNQGVVQWQRALGGAAADEGFRIGLDSSNNVYIAGFTASQGAGGNDIVIAKWNTSGTLQWQKRIGAPTDDQGLALTVSSSGTCTLAGKLGNNGCIIQVDSSGTMLSQHSILHATGIVSFNAVAVDGVGDIYAAGSLTLNSVANMYLVKLNSSGTILWQFRSNYNGNAYDDILEGVFAQSGYLWISGRIANDDFSGADQDFYIAKVNPSNGSIDWQIQTGTNIENEGGFSITADSNGNSYVAGTNYLAAYPEVAIAKYNPSGTNQWVRTFTAPYSGYGHGITVDNSGNFYVAAQITPSLNNIQMALLKFPTSGGRTGTRNGFTYASSSMTSYSSSMSTVDPVCYRLYPSLTLNSATLTQTTTTATSTKVNF